MGLFVACRPFSVADRFLFIAESVIYTAIKPLFLVWLPMWTFCFKR
jgi:hypothetical protein